MSTNDQEQEILRRNIEYGTSQHAFMEKDKEALRNKLNTFSTDELLEFIDHQSRRREIGELEKLKGYQTKGILLGMSGVWLSHLELDQAIERLKEGEK